MVKIDVTYDGEYCNTWAFWKAINHNAPVDNMGKGESFSPTDLFHFSAGLYYDNSCYKSGFKKIDISVNGVEKTMARPSKSC